MRPADYLRLILGTLRAYGSRSLLTLSGIAIGIAAVILLTAIGGGVQRFVLAQFTQFGTHLIAVTPGKSQTFGLSGALIGTVRPLTVEDAEALRRLPLIEGVVPMVMGNVEVEAAGRSRRTTLFGVGPDLPRVWRLPVAAGRFFPPGNRPLAALGATVRRALFGGRPALGRRLRIGGESYRITAVMQPKGKMLGFDLDDAVYVPVRRALALFDREGLMEIDLLYRSDADVHRVVERVRRLLIQRHGREDFTLITQDQMLETLGSVLEVLTLAVAALGGVSLLVGGIGILTLQTVAVAERRAEIGLLRALGARQRQVLLLFLGEALALALAGALLGLLAGLAGAGLIAWQVAEIPARIDWRYALAALGLAGSVGVAAGTIPAWQATRVDPVTSLRGE
ncbi:putative ABC transport system permease protein [Methylomarinovum tepidoasis]|uniref:ABC transport system permease protein n=1 Tax=Methylomarinovum tepidoasis TaxID=2840183 RepID=A0AAU9D3N6_9GAMM|nr:ABC transporter permease [Methylomarinovum sp. IN45]BCX89589.1 putative ABC transport system permease protein [Methylomarinovum sp. IN45]